jgi:hydrogenase nickel incorporation protein HypB
MFQKSDLVLLTKVDLLPYLEVRVEQVLDSLSRVMPNPVMFPVSARTGEGISRWVQWLGERRIESRLPDRRQRRSPRPPVHDASS